MADQPLWTVAISIRPLGGRRGWDQAGEGFTARLAAQESATVIAPEVASLSFRGGGSVRVNLVMAVAAPDPPAALALAWLVIRKASGGRLTGWDIPTARTAIDGERSRQ